MSVARPLARWLCAVFAAGCRLYGFGMAWHFAGEVWLRTFEWNSFGWRRWRRWCAFCAWRMRERRGRAMLLTGGGTNWKIQTPGWTMFPCGWLAAERRL